MYLSNLDSVGEILTAFSVASRALSENFALPSLLLSISRNFTSAVFLWWYKPASRARPRSGPSESLNWMKICLYSVDLSSPDPKARFLSDFFGIDANFRALSTCFGSSVDNSPRSFE